MPGARLPVRLLPLAEQDLDEAVCFLAEESPRAAARLAVAFERGLSRLSLHPELGRLPKDAHLLGMRYRVLIVGQYLAFYVIAQEAVVVHRIIHGARDLHGLL